MDNSTESEIRDFLVKYPVLLNNGEIRVSIGLNTPFAYNMGSKCVYINKSAWLLDKESAKFCIKHEIGHAYNNKVYNLAFNIPLILSVGLSSGMGSVPMAAVFIVSALHSRRVIDEFFADRYAIQRSNIDELKGGFRIFNGINKIIQSAKKQLPIIVPLLEMIDVHPNTNYRTKQIERSLLAHNVIYEPSSDVQVPIALSLIFESEEASITSNGKIINQYVFNNMVRSGDTFKNIKLFDE